MSHKSANYLIDEYPLFVLPSLAMVLDRNPNLAMLLQQMHFWIGVVKRSEGRQGRFKDGRWWIYNSVAAWNRQLPFLNERTIRRHLKRLETLGILIKEEEVDLRAKGGSRTWFSIDYDRLNELIREYQQAVDTSADEGGGQIAHPQGGQNAHPFTDSLSSDSQDPESNNADLPPAAKSALPAALDAGSSIKNAPSRTDRANQKKIKSPERQGERVLYEDLTPLGKCVVDICGRGTNMAVTPNLTGAQVDALAAEYEVSFKGQVFNVTPDDLFKSDPLYKQWIETEVYAFLRVRGGDKPIARGAAVRAVTMQNAAMNLAEFYGWRETVIEKQQMDYALAHAETTPEKDYFNFDSLDDDLDNLDE